MSGHIFYIKMTEVDETDVSIRFIGTNLDPQDLGEILQFVESETTKSTIKILKNGVVVWSIKLNENVALTPEKKIEALLANFTKEINAWELVTENVKADIFCGLFLNGWNRGLDLTPNLLKEISNRNLKIGFDIYAPTDSWDELNNSEFL